MLILSVAIPIAFIAHAAHVRRTIGLTWLSAVGSLIALSLVIAVPAVAARR